MSRLLQTSPSPFHQPHRHQWPSRRESLPSWGPRNRRPMNRRLPKRRENLPNSLPSNLHSKHKPMDRQHHRLRRGSPPSYLPNSLLSSLPSNRTRASRQQHLHRRGNLQNYPPSNHLNRRNKKIRRRRCPQLENLLSSPRNNLRNMGMVASHPQLRRGGLLRRHANPQPLQSLRRRQENRQQLHKPTPRYPRKKRTVTRSLRIRISNLFSPMINAQT